MGRKDQERYQQTGMIHRGGKLVNAEQWHRDNPTKSETKAKVKDAVKAELAKKFGSIPEQKAQPVPHRYYCTACRHYHTQSSKVGKEHLSFHLAE